jgi:hypothetical protein
LNSTEELIRAAIPHDEVALASGRCDELINDQRLDASGSVATVVVTGSHLHWASWGGAFHLTSLPLSTVTGVREQAARHRCLLTMEHAPLERVHHVPAHRMLVFSWGNANEVAWLSRTVLRFSRRETEAVVALRTRLEAQGLAWLIEEDPRPPDDPEPHYLRRIS